MTSRPATKHKHERRWARELRYVRRTHHQGQLLRVLLAGQEIESSCLPGLLGAEGCAGDAGRVQVEEGGEGIVTEAEIIKAQLLRNISEVSDHFGIYPQAVKGHGDERDYEQRDGFKNGWNAAVREYVRRVEDVLDVYSCPWDSPEYLFSAADGIIDRHGSEWYVNLSDTWYWACADAETIPKDEYKLVAEMFKHLGASGLLYWARQKRGHDPTIQKVKEELDAITPLAKPIYDRYATTANSAPQGTPCN